ncbi:unnamed protein product, partial [Ectocarpus fasciculatus]
ARPGQPCLRDHRYGLPSSRDGAGEARGGGTVGVQGEISRRLSSQRVGLGYDRAAAAAATPGGRLEGGPQSRPLCGGRGAGEGIAPDPSADGLVGVRWRQHQRRLRDGGGRAGHFGEQSALGGLQAPCPDPEFVGNPCDQPLPRGSSARFREDLGRGMGRDRPARGVACARARRFEASGSSGGPEVQPPLRTRLRGPLAWTRDGRDGAADPLQVSYHGELFPGE